MLTWIGNRAVNRDAEFRAHLIRQIERSLWRCEPAARRAVPDLPGVRGVTNLILVQSRVKTIDVRDKIEVAFKRSAEIDARRINVTATDGKVILSGHVRSWAERQEAERVAWAAPGVTQVEDRLSITP